MSSIVWNFFFFILRMSVYRFFFSFFWLNYTLRYEKHNNHETFIRKFLQVQQLNVGVFFVVFLYPLAQLFLILRKLDTQDDNNWYNAATTYCYNRQQRQKPAKEKKNFENPHWRTSQLYTKKNSFIFHIFKGVYTIALGRCIWMDECELGSHVGNIFCKIMLFHYVPTLYVWWENSKQ